jgi:hypothetical protein
VAGIALRACGKVARAEVILLGIADNAGVVDLALGEADVSDCRNRVFV